MKQINKMHNVTKEHLHDSDQRKQTEGVITLLMISLIFEDARYDSLPHTHTVSLCTLSSSQVTSCSFKGSETTFVLCARDAIRARVCF